MHKFEKDIAQVFGNRFLQHGPVPEASMWYSEKRQFIRFEIMFEQIKLLTQKNTISISDIGCGYGAFLNFLSEKNLNEEWFYNGYDVSDEVIKFCRQEYLNRASFHRSSVPTRKTDFIIMSGTYNFFPLNDYNSWKQYLFRSLKMLWAKTDCAMIFNLQTSDRENVTDDGIVYTSQVVIENFCNSTFGNVRVIFNPNIPNDATFVIKK